MKDYSAMSDFEINGLVAVSTQKIGDHTQARGLTFIHEYGEPLGEFGSLCIGWKEFDPCNNPADAWPIILQHKINIDHRASIKAGAMAKLSGNNEIYAVNDNPLRAAMEVYLQMMGWKS